MERRTTHPPTNSREAQRQATERIARLLGSTRATVLRRESKLPSWQKAAYR